MHFHQYMKDIVSKQFELQGPDWPLTPDRKIIAEMINSFSKPDRVLLVGIVEANICTLNAMTDPARRLFYTTNIMCMLAADECIYIKCSRQTLWHLDFSLGGKIKATLFFLDREELFHFLRVVLHVRKLIREDRACFDVVPVPATIYDATLDGNIMVPMCHLYCDTTVMEGIHD